MATLFVLGFLHRTTADAAAQDMLGLDADLALDPDALAVVSSDDDGSFQVTTHHLPGRDERQTFWHLLLAALVFVPASPSRTDAERRDLARQLRTLGMDEGFQDRLRGLLAPESSVLFLLVDDVVPVEALASLRRFGARLVSAALVPDVESRIARVLPQALAPTHGQSGADV